VKYLNEPAPMLPAVRIPGAKSLSIIRLTQINEGELGATAFAGGQSAGQGA
jgi:hypothetical protein